MPTIGGGRITPGTGEIDYVTDGTGAGVATTTPSSASKKTETGYGLVSGRNVGLGYGVYAGTNGSKDLVLDFKSLVAGSGIYLADDGNAVTISTVGAPGTLYFRSLVEAPANIAANGILYGADADHLQFVDAPSTANTALTWNGSAFAWQAMASGTVTSVALVGNNGVTVSGQPVTGSGSFTVGLEPTGVSAGNYVAPTLTIDSHGRVTAAVGNTLGEINTGSNLGTGIGLFSQKNGTSLQFKTLKAGSNISMSDDGTEVTIASTVGVTSVDAFGSYGVTVTGGPITSSGTLDIRLTDTGVTPGAYTSANVTVDAQGRVVAVANGSPGVTSVGALGSNGITVSGGPITASGTLNISLDNTAVSAGSYTAPTLVIDAQGRITSAVANQIVTGASNLGTAGTNIGYVFANKTGENLTFRRILAVGGLTLSETGSDIIIDGSSLSGGTGGITGLTILDEGGQIGTDITTINFVGPNVTSSVNGSITTVTVSGGGTVTSVDASGSNGITVTGGPIGTTGTLNIGLGPSGVTAGIYTLPTVSIDTQGRITAATANGPVSMGTGTSLLADTGVLNFKSLKGGANVSLSTTGNEITISSSNPGGTVTSVNATGSNGVAVTGGPITSSGTLNVSLTSTGVVAGTYSAASITVDAYGRISSATATPVGETNTGANLGTGIGLFSQKNGATLEFKSIKAGSNVTLTDNPATGEVTIAAASSGVTSIDVTGSNGITVSGGPITSSGTLAIGLAESGVTAGSYTAPTLVVDAQGRITAATSNAVINSVSSLGTGVSLYNGTVTGDAQFRSLKAGANITLAEANGEITIAASGSGSGTVTSVAVTGSSAISVSGSPITNSGTIALDLTDTGVTAGTYNSITVDVKGRVTAASTVTTGEANTASNVGTGIGLYKTKSGVDLQFKSLKNGNRIGLTDDTVNGDVVLAVDDSGLITGASNLGTTGTNVGYVFEAENAGELRFRRIVTSGGITLSQTATDLIIDGSAISGGTGTTGVTILDEGTSVGTEITSLNFVGGGVTASVVGSVATIDITAATGVTSVAVSGSSAITVSGSPITSSGTIALDLSNTGVTAGTYNSVTVDAKGRVTAASTVAVGESNTASNLGAGIGVFKDKSGADLRFKSLVAGTNVTLDENTSTGEITVSATAGGSGTVTSVAAAGTDGITVSGSPITSSGTLTIGMSDSGVTAGTYNSVTVDAKGRVTAGSSIAVGETNTAANLGTGIGVFKEKAGVELRFNSLKSGTNITLSENPATGEITVDGASFVSSVDASGSNGITVTGGPITSSGTLAISLDDTGVAAGTYNSVTVNAQGRVTAASNVTVGESNTASNLGAGIGVFKDKSGADLRFKSLVAGTNVTLNENTSTGEITIDSSGGGGSGTVTSVGVTGSSAITVSGSPITSSGTITLDLTDTGVAAGTYNTLTVDAKGRITTASNTAYLTANETITLSGDVTGAGGTAIATTLSNSGVAAGTYTNATVTVDAKGRVTSASSGAAGGSITVQDEGTSITTAATTLNFTGSGVSASHNAGITTINVPGGAGEQTEIVEFLYTAGTGGTLAGADSLVSQTSGVTATITDGANAFVQFDFTGHAYPPTSVVILGQAYASNEFLYQNISQVVPTRKIAGGGTASAPTLMGAFTRMTLQLRMQDTNSSAGFGQRARCYVMFKF